VTPLLVLRSGLLGVVAGLRSAIPAAALAVGGLEPASRPLALLASRGARRAAVLAAAGELVVDKLPVTPDRVDSRGLISRVASGALAGAMLASATGVRGSRLLVPVLAGGGGAYLGSWGGFAARQALGKATRLPDPAVAVAEDLVAVVLAAVAVRSAGGSTPSRSPDA
jgi:uncharacterized membrane protein